MSNFDSLNGKQISNIQIKAGEYVRNAEIFKKYDKNNNSIWDAEEIQEFYNDLKNIAGEDGVLDEEESISLYAKLTDISKEEARNTIRDDKSGNKIYTAFNAIVQERAKEYATEIILEDTKEGLEQFHYIMNKSGDISKTYNDIKDLFGTEYSGKKVYRQLAKNHVSGKILEEALEKGGLTYAEYTKKKIELLKRLLGSENIEYEENGLLEQSIEKMSMPEMDSLIQKLANCEDGEYNTLKNNTLKQLKNKNDSKSGALDGGSYKLSNPNSIGFLLHSQNAENILKFEQIFQAETGRTFLPQNIQAYKESKQLLDVVITLNNKIVERKNALTHFLSAGLGGENFDERSVKVKMNQLLFETFDGDREQIEKFLKKYGASIDFDSDFANLNFDSDLPEDTLRQQLRFMVGDLQQNLNNKLSKLMNGKTIEDYCNDTNQKYKNAFGDNPVDLASEFEKSQQEGVEYAKMLTIGAGLVLGLSTGGAVVALAGAGIAMFGGVAVSAVEAGSKQGGMTKEDKKVLLEELKTAAIFVPAGFGAGAAGVKVGFQLLKNCPKLVQYVGQYGTEAVLGALTSYAVTGDVDLSAETISNLMNIAAGIVAHRKIAKVNKNHPQNSSGEVNPPTKNNVQEPKTEKVKVGENEVEAKVSEGADGSKNYDFSELGLKEDITASNNSNSSGLFGKAIQWAKEMREYQRLKSKIPDEIGLLDTIKDRPDLVSFLNKFIDNGGYDKNKTFFTQMQMYDIKSITKYNDQICQLFLSLQKANVSVESLMLLVYRLRVISCSDGGIERIKNLNLSVVESLEKFAGRNIDESTLLAYVESRILHPAKSASDFVKNFVAPLQSNPARGLRNMISDHYLSNIQLYLKEMEINRKSVDISELKNIFSKYIDDLDNILKKNNKELAERVTFDIEYLANHDKAMLEEVLKIMNKTSKKSAESTSEYFKRVCDIRAERAKRTKQSLLEEQKKAIENGYGDDNYETLVLSQEEMRNYKRKGGDKKYVGDVTNTSTAIGGDPRSSSIRPPSTRYPEFERYAFQKYPRYNSTEFVGSDGNYKYAPVYRFLDPKDMSIKTFSEKFFPNIGKEYSPSGYQCCMPRFGICAQEAMVEPRMLPVVMEIHPRSETSKAFLVGGKGGEEMRYPAGTKFKVINKYTEIYEDSYLGQRVPMMRIVLQEL